MYSLHHTDGFIIKSLPKGEANMMFHIFTRDMGMIWASAQGVRKQDSKLRPHLQEFSLSHISFVKGKETWRITSSNLKSNLYKELSYDKSFTFMSARIFSLLRRLLHGEEENKELFAILEETFSFICETKPSREILLNIEAVVMLRILANLGYMSEREDLKEFIKSPIYSDVVLGKMGEIRRVAFSAINKSLKNTHL